MLDLRVLSLLLGLAMCGPDTCSTNKGKEGPFYISFVHGADEGWNAHRDILLRFTHLVKQLNDEHPGVAWTLVLPHIHRMEHVNNFPENGAAWGNYLDMESLRKVIPVIDYSEYQSRVTKPVISAWWMIPPQPVEKVQGRIGYMKEMICAIQHLDSIKKGRFFLYQFNGVSQDWCFYTTGTHFLEEISRVFHTAPQFSHCYETLAVTSSSTMKQVIHGNWELGKRNTIIFANGGASNWDPYTAVDWKKYKIFACSVLPSPHIVAKAQSFIKKVICKGKPQCRFGGIHLRRGDFLKTHPDTTPSIQEVAVQIGDLQELYRFNNYFVATDSPLEEMEELKTLLASISKDIRLITYTPKDDDMDDLEKSLIEQTIVVASTYFVGCPSSTFSRTITEFRDCGFMHKKIPSPKSTYNALCTEINTVCNLNHWDRYVEHPKYNVGKRD